MIYNLSKNEIINLKNALYISKQEVNISLSHLNDSRKQAAMSFAREFNDFSDEDINDILTMLKKLKGVVMLCLIFAKQTLYQITILFALS
mgnify:CR=1 FL=1